MIKSNLSHEGDQISITPTHDEILDSHFDNIFKRLRKIDIALECIYQEINQSNPTTTSTTEDKSWPSRLQKD